MSAPSTQPTDAAPVLSIDGLTVALPAWSDRPHAVENLSIQIRRNEVLCVVGESGSGKSVMAKSILGLLPAPHVRVTAGRIAFEGEDLLQVAPERLRAVRSGRISMIFQEPMVALNPLMKVGRQVDEVLQVHTDLSARARRERVLGLFDDVHLPEPARIHGSYPHQLSGGQRQRVMIAMALALEPALIIADEPTTALDVTTQAQILSLLKELQGKHGTAVLFITHDFGVVAEIADRVAVMRHGRLIEQGDSAPVLRAPREPYTRDLVAAVPSLIPRHPDPAAVDDHVLAVRALSKTYGGRSSFLGVRSRGVEAVRSVSLEVPRGRSVALVGESGSGKSTLARCIVGLEQPDSGAILLDGQDIAGLSRAALRPYRHLVQMVFQDPFASLNPRQRVGDIIALGPTLRGVPRDVAWDRARELLDMVGLQREAVGRFPHEFSGGQRQRIGIARALAMDPKLIIADEPVSALDVSVQKQVLDLLDELRLELGLSMLFITHDLRVAAHVCEEIAVMRRGEIVERGSTARIFAAPAHEYTRALLDSVPGKGWEH
ncbi:MAG: ABC transporter ATP-binding protein [Ectothiorhodospiraceae bacterium]|nr:ABC transporter ATP-binding protein [Ectothiorhodospiraceae bacterium]